VRKYPRVTYLQVALAGALQTAGRHDEALVLLAEYARGARGEPRVHEMQARSYAATGKVMSQHQSLGEYYALAGSAQAALEQFQLARCAGGGDFYQQSIIDSRIRAMYERVLAERAERAEAEKGSFGVGAGTAKPLPPQLPQGRCS
jgi:predicted Zn-dependent protease